MALKLSGFCNDRVNIGDVVQDVDRIYGEGVNIAARIESLADAGGICISRSTYDQIKNKLELETEYLGEHEVKNIKEPVRVYKVLVGTDAPKHLVEDQFELPDKPSIAVLPFDNMSGDPSQEYFSDGLTEQIINGLCKVSNLFVIARNSSFAYKGKPVNVKQIAKELGVRYILEGSVQRTGDRVRINVQLIDASTDYHMWSEHYDRELVDIFALQDEITSRLITAMEVNLTFGEQARLWRGAGTTSIKAYDKLMQARDYYYRHNKQDNVQARKLANDAIKIDKDYAFAYVVLGAILLSDLKFGSSNNITLDIFEAKNCALKALDLIDSFDLAHALLGHLYWIAYKYNKAIEEMKKAVALNPNGADAHAHLAFSLNSFGKSDKAIKLIKRALRLNPIPPPDYYAILGSAYRMNGQHLEAIETCKKAIFRSPEYMDPYITMAASYSSLERYQKAREIVTKIRKISPKLSIDGVIISAGFEQKADLDDLVQTLRKAGLPEHSPE